MPRRVSIAIHLILLGLLLPPLHYYLFNSDKRDERFAWRMFSPVRVENCGTQFFVGENGAPIKVANYFHNAWLDFTKRGRKQAIAAMAQRLCDDNPGQSVRVRILCEERPRASAGKPRLLYDNQRSTSDEDIEVVAHGAFDFCKIGAL